MNVLLSPVIVFVIFSLLVGFLSVLAARRKKADRYLREGSTKAYACGEDIEGFQPQVSYHQFFIYALFFTILHVAALILGTIPKGSTGMPIIYLAVVVLGLFILVRREHA